MSSKYRGIEKKERRNPSACLARDTPASNSGIGSRDAHLALIVGAPGEGAEGVAEDELTVVEETLGVTEKGRKREGGARAVGNNGEEEGESRGEEEGAR